MIKTIQKLFCKITLRSAMLALGLILATELSARPELNYSESAATEAAVEMQQPEFKLTGRIVDENNAGVAGATIQIKGGSRGVITDNDGNFSIEVTGTEVLDVSYLGYEPKSVPVANNRTLLINIVPKSSELDAVTVVAYGTQRKESIVGAISTLDYKDLSISTGQLSSSLAGKLAGIVVMQRTGEPGAGADFWIRGVSTFGSYNRPLVLVDGVERDMDLVDTDDIATFSILKDATATALYGVRGANGIVIITTKRGAESKPKLSVKAEFGMTQPVKLPEMANTQQWLDYFNDVSVGSGNVAPFPKGGYDYQMFLSGEDPDVYPSVDWVDTIFKNMARTGRVNANVTGGTKTVRYYVGAGYYTESGIFNMAQNDRYDAQMNFNKFNFRSNVDINLTPSTELGLSLSTQYTTKNTPGLSQASSSSIDNIYNYTMLVTPIATPTVFSDGTVASPKVGHNPYNLLNNSGYQRSTNIIAQSLLSLTQDFSGFVTEGLKANVKFSWDANNGNILNRWMAPMSYNVDRTAPRDAEGNLIYHGSVDDGHNYMQLAKSNTSSTAINLEASLIYERLFGADHRVSGMFLYSMRSRTNNVPDTYINAFPYRNMGIAGRATYSFRDKYFAEVNFGYNGSENFSPGNRFGFFPSIALGYMISNEKFWEPIAQTVNYLKIRGSYGMVGNDQIGGNRRFAYNTTLNTTSAPQFTFGTSGFGPTAGIITDQYGNPNVGWEESTKSNIGVEFGLFRRFRIQADYFYEKREGIYIPRESIPSVVGVNAEQWVNLGRMRNQGVDMSLEYDHQINKDLFISARGNFTFNRNKKLYDDKPSQKWPYQNAAGFANQQQMGYIAVGLFEDQEDIDNWVPQTLSSVHPGDIKYRDINGDGKVDRDDMVAIGYSTIPEINYGFGASIVWKGIDFSLFFSGVGNVTRIITGANLFGTSSNPQYTGQIYADVAKKRWTSANPNPNAAYPRMTLNDELNNRVESTFWQRNMSFLRLKNVELGYTLPKRISSKMGMSTMRIYVQGINLLTFSEFKLWDPELEANYGNRYPTMRNVTLGLNLNF